MAIHKTSFSVDVTKIGIPNFRSRASISNKSSFKLHNSLKRMNHPSRNPSGDPRDITSFQTERGIGKLNSVFWSSVVGMQGEVLPPQTDSVIQADISSQIPLLASVAQSVPLEEMSSFQSGDSRFGRNCWLMSLPL